MKKYIKSTKSVVNIPDLILEGNLPYILDYYIIKQTVSSPYLNSDYVSFYGEDHNLPEWLEHYNIWEITEYGMASYEQAKIILKKLKTDTTRSHNQEIKKWEKYLKYPNSNAEEKIEQIESKNYDYEIVTEAINFVEYDDYLLHYRRLYTYGG